MTIDRPELGLAVIASGETVAGARRFTAGAGRHGAPVRRKETTQLDED